MRHSYEESAEEGHDLAQLYLGTCCKKGFGTDKDMERAFGLFSSAAESGLAVAQVTNPHLDLWETSVKLSILVYIIASLSVSSFQRFPFCVRLHS